MESKLLDAYYAFKGWNHEGVPTGKTLAELKLDYVRKDFGQRGILTESEDAPLGEVSA